MEKKFKNIDDLKKEINSNHNLMFNIKVVANSKNNSIDFCEEYIKIKIKQRAIENKANKAIIEYLSDLLNISKNKISIVTGEHSSQKIIKISS